MLVQPQMVMMNKIRRIYLVGPMPPPVHGMSMVTAATYKKLIQLGGGVDLIDLSADSLDRALYVRLARIRKILLGLYRLISKLLIFPDSVLYVALSGGLGQIYDLLFICVARIMRAKIVIHHHNIVYVEQYRRVFDWITCIAGSNAVHVVASQKISSVLVSNYPKVASTYVMSAIVVTEVPNVDLLRFRAKVRAVGFIGNISEAKGIFDFLDLIECMEKLGVALTAWIAGPFQCAKIESVVRRRLLTLPSVTYLGPIYGHDKSTFYDRIDVLIFPVRAEYEGIVIHEAMSFAVPVIARDSGCISEIVNSNVGCLVSVTSDFKEEACQCILKWLDEPKTFNQISRSARLQFIRLYAENAHRLENLCNSMIENASRV